MWNDARHKRAFSPVTQRSDASAGVSGGATDEKGKLLGGAGGWVRSTSAMLMTPTAKVL